MLIELAFPDVYKEYIIYYYGEIAPLAYYKMCRRILRAEIGQFLTSRLHDTITALEVEIGSACPGFDWWVDHYDDKVGRVVFDPDFLEPPDVTRHLLGYISIQVECLPVYVEYEGQRFRMDRYDRSYTVVIPEIHPLSNFGTDVISPVVTKKVTIQRQRFGCSLVLGPLLYVTLEGIQNRLLTALIGALSTGKGQVITSE